MKGKQFYFLLISLILVGVGSVFLYRQREEQRVLEFEGYEITAIESRIESLYNSVCQIKLEFILNTFCSLYIIQ